MATPDGSSGILFIQAVLHSHSTETPQLGICQSLRLQSRLGARFRCRAARFFLRLLLLLKADAAQNRPALRRLEGHRCCLAALRAVDPGLRPHPRAAADALRLALLAMLGVVLELFVVEEELLAGSEYKLGAAIAALQDSVGKFHGRLPHRRKTF